MKKIVLFTFYLVMLSGVEASISLFSQNAWMAGNESQKRFIENKGQFDNMNPGFATLYSADRGKTKILFSKNGLTYRLDNPKRNPEHKEGSGKPKYLANYDLVYMNWENSNPNVLVIAEELAGDYFSYTKTNGENINYIKGYTKLIYKNLYPNIDVEYIFPPSPEGEGRGEAGIKYSIILHPGADASQIKMKYSGSSLRAERSNLILDAEGNIRIPTKFGDIIDHAPFTFYESESHAELVSASVKSSFSISGDAVSFSLGKYDKTKTIVIDPWAVTPTIGNSNGVWECEVDGAGNVYIIGGDSPMKLLKYNSAGAIQWTYSTPWDTASTWLGTLKTDLTGNSYVTAGSTAAMQKINTNAGLVWNVTGSNMDEYWTLAFNCNQTKLITGGTRLVTFPAFKGYGCAFNIDLNNGTVVDTLIVASITSIGPTSAPNEIRTICSSPNGETYFLTLDTIGYFNSPSFTSLFTVNSGLNFAYKCENFRPNNGNGGMSSIKANEKFVYTQNGTNVHMRSLATGAIITTAAIPGGISTLSFGRYTVGNSGIDIDSCGNVYAGSANQVIKYDANLNILSAVPTTYAVSDVVVSNNGNVIVCGTTGTSASTSRTGYVESINMSACLPMDTSCSDSSAVSVQNNSPVPGWNLILQNPPVGNELAGNLFAPENADVLVTIIDMLGKTVKKNQLKVSKGVNSFRMDVPAESGTYFIVISDSTSGRQLVKKFVKL